MKIGIISDTHGLLRPEAIAALEGCEHIIHAGDIGSAEIVEQLKSIAPLHIVRGNNDMGAPWADTLPDHLRFELNGWQVLLVHDIADVPALLEEPSSDPVKLVVTGHSHKPCIEWRGERLYLNPGSAGRRRFKLPVTLALLDVRPASLESQLVQLLD